MADYFPEEVFLEVLARLPVKTVLQCTSVCKTWRSLITGPDLTTHHLNSYSKINDFVLLSVRKHVVTPKPSVIFKTHGPLTQVHGFGFDDVRSDYKLVRIAYVSYTNDKVVALVEVYSLKSRGWRLVENDLSYVIYEGRSSVFVYGMSHWLAHAPDDSQIGVVPFAFGSESFGKMMAVPGSLDWDDYINMSVGLLALVPYKRCPVKDFYSVWVMKEYGDVGSWSKLYTFQECEISRVVSFRKDEPIVLTKADGDRPVSCSFDGDLLVTLDLRTNAEWNPDRKHWGTVGSFYVDRFLESLVLLCEPDVASDEKEDVEDKTTAASTESSSD